MKNAEILFTLISLFLLFPFSTQILFHILIFQAQSATFYVNENNPSSTPDGSLQNPFTSIKSAYQSIGPIKCELILLDSSISLSSVLAFTEGANYTIR